MNCNNEVIEYMMEGSEHLYTMLTVLCEGIGDLPNSKMTADLKEIAEDAKILGMGVYETMHLIAENTGSTCAECSEAEYSNKYDNPEADIPASTDVQEFFNQVATILALGTPLTVSANIYLNSPETEDNGDA